MVKGNAVSLLNLKKSSPSVSPKNVNVEDFINGALAYSLGEGLPRELQDPVALSIIEGPACLRENKTKHATFSLNQDTIASLTKLSAITGISKSRIIRILVQQQLKNGNLASLFRSPIK